MVSRKTSIVVGVVAAAGVAAAALAGAGSKVDFSPGGGDKLPVIKASTAPIFAPPPGGPVSFADIFEKVSPAVVSINVTSKVDASALRRIPGFENFPFAIPGQPRGQDDEEGQGEDGENGGGPTQQSSGSGFFISADGYIVTNNHVVSNAEEITVVLKDGRELKATIVGRDEGTDLAVLKVEGRDFPYVDFENQAKPRVGDWVITVGNPFGLGGTATAGIISAYGRDIGETFVDYIQIDAPINRGNSGGPTFDIYGRVIGVNTAIFSPSGGSVGIGFAIPADVADGIVKQLISGGRIARGYIGATIQNVTPEMREALGLGEQKGAIIAELTPGGPAERAGLQQGDVVVAVNGQTVEGSSEMTREVAKARAGDMIRMELLRGGKRQRLEIRSGTRPSETELAESVRGGGGAVPAPKGVEPQGAPVLGMNFAPIDPASRSRFSIDEDVNGVMVTALKPGSDAAQKGLRRGDVITRAGDRDVRSAGDVAAAVDSWKRLGRTSIAIGVHRQGRTLLVPIKID